ncbi:phosphomannomutase CpsG [uncultured Shewanella sp.]|uniref:phosphomannomutase CpsG n=1 Tax=uncultured Shewanella sp. TaxID=173975 RepID=UPI002601AC27|nr:phosphomannomutase CpsG [uncultured Shewanella sp.]
MAENNPDNATLPLTCFKTYDIRGKLETELNPQIAYRIARAFADIIKPKTVVLGGDARLTSASLKQALASGFMDAGVNVLDLGLTGTEEVYFATFHLKLDAGIQVTASHNPIDYNGMKFVGKNAEPIGPDNGLQPIKLLAESQAFSVNKQAKGHYHGLNLMPDYIKHLLSYIQPHHIKPLKILVNAGNGPAAKIIDELEVAFKQLQTPITFIKINHDIDGRFPNGIPNPLLKENRQDTQNAITLHQADLGIAWDGDFDRCFFFDEQGEFLDSYYVVGLLADAFLQKNSQSNIIHDPRLIWHTQHICQKHRSKAIQCRTGHVFIKQKMRQTHAAYGGEVSGHHYFRDFAYCDSGMIPWLLLIELLSIKNQPLSTLVAESKRTYPNSGEINFTVSHPIDAINKVKAHYQDIATHIDTCDGISFSFENKQQAWRFNLRYSNTEPLIRLNVESKGNRQLVVQKTNEIIAILK